MTGAAGKPLAFLGRRRGHRKGVRWLAAVSSMVCGLVAAACDNPVAPNDLAGNFRVLWEDFDRTYPFFVVKQIDWNALRAEHEHRAETATTQAQLFEILSELLLELEDGHVSLDTPFGAAQFTGWRDRFPSNYDPALVLNGHLEGSIDTAPQGTMRYGLINGNVGYVHIPSWSGSGHDADIDTVLQALPNIAALIIDVRDNGGGNDMNGRAVAGRFADQRRLFRRVQYRNGAGHGDFTPPVEDFIDPAGPDRFEGAVALLTNRRVFSSSESFVLAMRVLPTVTVVGDTTGGGSANPAQRTLPIGWRYRVSRWLVTTPEGASFEGRGLAPDVPRSLNPDDVLANRDSIILAALEVLLGPSGLGSQ